MNGVECLCRLTQSPIRIRLLEELRGGGATTEQLTTAFDVHRRTIMRNLKSLEECGWVSARQQEYSVTPAARLFLDELFDALERLPAAAEVVEFYEHVPTEAVDIPPESFADASVVTSESKNPHAPLMAVQSAVSTASEVRTLAPVSTPLYTDIYATPIAKGIPVETVLTADAARTLLASHANELRTEFDGETVRVSVTEHPMPFGLVMTECSTLIGGYDDGVLQSVLEVGSTELDEWARQEFERRQVNARPLEEFVAENRCKLTTQKSP